VIDKNQYIYSLVLLSTPGLLFLRTLVLSVVYLSAVYSSSLSSDDSSMLLFVFNTLKFTSCSRLISSRLRRLLSDINLDAPSMPPNSFLNFHSNSSAS